MCTFSINAQSELLKMGILWFFLEWTEVGATNVNRKFNLQLNLIQNHHLNYVQLYKLTTTLWKAFDIDFRNSNK